MKSLTIAGRWNVNLHNMNNEGTEGNFIQPRTVTIVRNALNPQGDGDTTPTPQLHTVNALSGDMMKHIHADYFRQIALDDIGLDGVGIDEAGIARLNAYDGALPLSRNSVILDPNRISTEEDMVEMLEDQDVKNSTILDHLIKTCALTDVHGILMTAKKRMVPRKSRIEFGWVVAVPELSETEHYIHVKYAKENATDLKKDDDATNKGQALFHRPASSAEYAVLIHVETDRIGLNELTMQSPISEEHRRARIAATLRALVQTLAHPYGAGRSQQAPHVGGFRGAVITSNSRIPAATVSPLEEDFMEEAKNTVTQMNRLGGDLDLAEVSKMSGLIGKVADLTEAMA